MKTTLEIPDAVFRQIKARSALQGKSMKKFVLEAIREKVLYESRPKKSHGWRAVYGKAPKGSLDEVRAIVDRQFSGIDIDEWR